MRGDDKAFLTASCPQRREEVAGPEFRYADLFSGCGGMSLGIEEAIAAAGARPLIGLAVDNTAAAANVYRANFRPGEFHDGIIQDLFEPLGSRISAGERDLTTRIGRLDLIAGGPPCQGNSDLNNYSRRNDPKNSLYQYMGRAAEVFEPTFVVAENVQGLPHDRSGALDTTVRALEQLGYSIWTGLIEAAEVGVAQRRRRHVLVASRLGTIDVQAVIDAHRTAPRSVGWAIADLSGPLPSGLLDQAARPSADNARRIDFLFDNGLLDLPNSERPPCHRDKAQSYNSVYGRLDWDKPSQTITSGFYSMCMGRYVHPAQRRTLTAHEAARLQFFPDSFDFTPAGNRTALAKMIANAVPPKLAYAVSRAVLSRWDRTDA